MSRVLALLIRLDALEERLDARRKSAPGQLDLFGSTTGSGGGTKCGASWIDPNKTCRIGQGGGAGDSSKKPIDTSKPFSKATMERIVSGIETRAFTSQGSLHDGTELALALQKLAEAPGLMGEHAREVMAFMDEVQAVAVIRPTTEHAPKLEVDESKGPPSWSTELSPEQNMQALLDWERPRLNAAERGRNYARRAGIWSDEFLDALKRDKSPKGQAMAEMISEARDGLGLDGQPTKSAKRRQELNEQWEASLQQLQAAKGTNTEHGAYMETIRAYDLMRFDGVYFHGGQRAMETVKGAIEQTLSSPGTGGHYWPGGNTYWKVSMQGKKGSRLNPEEIYPDYMEGVINSMLADQGKIRPYNFSSSPGLVESQRALTTHIHELGHMVHNTRYREIVETPGMNATTVTFARDALQRAPAKIQALVQQGKGPTIYADLNVAEMFAESFVAYVVAPEQMQNTNPELYEWVQQTLQTSRQKARDAQRATRSEYE